jgi:hypothetical protein
MNRNLYYEDLPIPLAARLPLECWQSAKHRVCFCFAIHRQWGFKNKVLCSSVNVVIALYEVLFLSLPWFQFCRRWFTEKRSS